MAIWRRIACCISKATRAQANASARAPTPTHTQKYVILVAFPQQQQRFRERASLLRYTCTASFVKWLRI